mmetsp:Transcript_22753/g.53736  ORF Transcript_22753/g.53736 Transcript_22753/m.53736 type:complete len:237 (+) Transcript_22753:1646-2356(+)
MGKDHASVAVFVFSIRSRRTHGYSSFHVRTEGFDGIRYKRFDLCVKVSRHQLGLVLKQLSIEGFRDVRFSASLAGFFFAGQGHRFACDSDFVPIVNEGFHYIVFFVRHGLIQQDICFETNNVGSDVELAPASDQKTGFYFGLENPAWNSSFLRNQIVQKSGFRHGSLPMFFDDTVDLVCIANKENTCSAASHWFFQNSNSCWVRCAVLEETGKRVANQILALLLGNIPIYELRRRT